jgi:hypothetical protein
VITSVESLPVMILLLGGLAKVTAAVAKINAATKNRAVSVFKIHKINRDLYFGYRNRRGLRLRKGRTDNLSKAGFSWGSVSHHLWRSTACEIHPIIKIEVMK